MRWHYEDEIGDNKVCIFANGDTFLEKVCLWFRGYRPHDTLIGRVMRKNNK